nr:MAG TPA: hypothetical protein [Caudoviricetes sp.]
MSINLFSQPSVFFHHNISCLISLSYFYKLPQVLWSSLVF